MEGLHFESTDLSLNAFLNVSMYISKNCIQTSSSTPGISYLSPCWWSSPVLRLVLPAHDGQSTIATQKYHRSFFPLILGRLYCSDDLSLYLVFELLFPSSHRDSYVLPTPLDPRMLLSSLFIVKLYLACASSLSSYQQFYCIRIFLEMEGKSKSFVEESLWCSFLTHIDQFLHTYSSLPLMYRYTRYSRSIDTIWRRSSSHYKSCSSIISPSWVNRPWPSAITISFCIFYPFIKFRQNGSFIRHSNHSIMYDCMNL